MKIVGRIRVPKLDTVKFTKALDEKLDIQMRQAARAWLRAVIPKVPVWAGTSRGSLQPLGRFLRVAVPIDPVAYRKNQGPDVGASLGSFSFEKNNGRYTFQARTEVTHFIYNNFYHAPQPPFYLKNPTPWGAFEAGEQAFRQYMAENLAKAVPKLKEFIKYKTLIIK